MLQTVHLACACTCNAADVCGCMHARKHVCYVCMYMCMRACARVYVRAFVRACMRVCACIVHAYTLEQQNPVN